MPAAAIDDSHLTALWEEFADRYCSEPLRALEADYPTRRSLVVKYEDIIKFDPQLAEQVVAKPDSVLPAFEKAIAKPTAGVMSDLPFEPHVRISGLPDGNLLVQNISSNHIDRLITIKGVVSKRAEVLHKVQVAIYECLLCNHHLRVPMTKKTLVPEVCPECKRRALKLDQESSYFVDIQRAEAQELLERVHGGTPAARLELYMEDDLVNTLSPGDTVELTGVVRLRLPNKTKGRPDTGQVYNRYLDILYASSMMRDFDELAINAEDERQILELSHDPKLYERITNSVAPGIYGHSEVKQAIALQMFGGTRGKTLPGNEPIREDIHLLLIGDPGSAKTRMVQYAISLVPKGIYVSGKSVSGVGLTASAEKDEIGDGGWTLKAGALVLASGGLAGVDEFDKIDDEDRAAMHEVMESQTVSIAKAGIVAKFKAKCAILAAANPKFGRFDRNRFPAEQFDIPPTLLSRFDLIFVIFDTMDKVRDTEMATKILANHQTGLHQSNTGIAEGGMDRELLKKYIAYARRHTNPILLDEAADKIKDYYVDLRSRGAKQGSVPITPRQIEGLVRLSEAAAKLRLSTKVQTQDAELAIKLVNFMQDEILRDKETGQLDVDIIATGRPKSQVDKINNILGITRQLQAQFDLVEINKIVEEAAGLNISEIDARRFIDELIYKGELYKVKHGFVKVVEQYG